ncbi:D-alanyl-D-alanine carboxypeptidase [Alphaproteobacteria bacterium]|nr:D-alanyl-D-alanine carboxypeptidase [Alphaproteobacteria bacterium]
MISRFLILSLLCLISASSAYAVPTIKTSAKQAFIIDYQTGTVLFEKNADDRMATSSMSKVITSMVVFDAIKRGEIALDDTFEVSEKAWKKGGSKMFVEVKKKVKVEDLIRGVTIQSGNDATIVLAEGLSGTEDEFAKRLNKMAASLGMTNSNFMNASGWPDDDHYSTARDLSTLGRALIRDYPEFYPIFSETEFTFNSIKQQNRNPLLYRNIGADGIKTGHTVLGGYGLMGSGVRDGRRVVLVVNGLESERARAQESAKLLDWALGRFKNYRFFDGDQSIAEANVVLGKEDTIPLVLKKPLMFTLPKGYEKELKVELSYNGPFVAPIVEGLEAGRLVISIGEQTLFDGPVFTGANVEQKGFFSRTLDKAKILVGGSIPSS